MIDFLAEKEILILCSIGSFVALIFIIILIQDMYFKKKEKAKLKQNTQELKNLTKQIEEKTNGQIQTKEPNIEIPSYEEMPQTPIEELSSQPSLEKENNPVDEKTSSIETPAISENREESPIVYKEEVYTKEEAQQELQRLTQELIQETEPEKIELTEFEAEQEENAIISLEELLAKGKKLILENEVTQYEDEGNEPISLEDLQRKMQKDVPIQQEVVVENTKETPKMVLNDFKSVTSEQEAYQSPRKYTPTPIISPVFGIEKEEVIHDESLYLENTANFEKLDDEIRKTNEFLAILKELEKKLD